MASRSRSHPNAVLQILDPGAGLTAQDPGRSGWLQYGIPRGGAMDDLALNQANLLVGNSPGQTVLEAALSGAKFRALKDVTLGIAGTEGTFAVGESRFNGWRTVFCRKGEAFEIRRLTQGVWTYLAVPSGFDVPPLLGSTSTFPDLKLGLRLRKRDVLRVCEPGADLPNQVGGRIISGPARRQLHQRVRLRIWPCPQNRLIGARTLTVLLTTEWTVSPKRDRVGYRLNGPRIRVRDELPYLEPIPQGAVQIDPEGRPVVAMRDAPTLGVSPKVGVLEPQDVGRLAQCRAGQKVVFNLVRPAR